MILGLMTSGNKTPCFSVQKQSRSKCDCRNQENRTVTYPSTDTVFCMHHKVPMLNVSHFIIIFWAYQHLTVITLCSLKQFFLLPSRYQTHHFGFNLTSHFSVYFVISFLFPYLLPIYYKISVHFVISYLFLYC